MLLLASLSAWIIFTLPLGFIQPPAASCLQRRNLTEFELRTPDVTRMLKRSVPDEFPRSLRLHFPIGQSPLDVKAASNYDDNIHSGWVKPLFSSIVYRTQDIQKAFFLLLLLVIIGEFFSAPAITLADSAVISLLGEDADRYGHQRMFGSLGWGLAMFFVGIALDHSTAFPDHPCGPEKQEKNYTICFATFSVLMGAALITATQINFKYDFREPEPEPVQKVAPPISHEEQMQNQLAEQLQLPSLAGPPATGATEDVQPLGAQVSIK